MNCRKCGTALSDGTVFCPNCGENQTQGASGSYSAGYSYGNNADYANQNAGYGNQNGGYGNQNGDYGNTNPYQYANTYNPVNNSAPTVKDYLKWMLLYPLVSIIPVVGFIVYIVMCFNFAFDKTNVARSNFYKALLICAAISIGVGVIIFLLMFALGFAMLDFADNMLDGAYYEIYNGFELIVSNMKALLVK